MQRICAVGRAKRKHMLIRAGIVTTVVTVVKIKEGYLIQENLELNNSNFCFYRYYPLVRASKKLKGRAQKRV